MILLLGGTTEAKQVASALDEAAIAYIYSTRTEVIFEGKGQYHYGSLTSESLKQFCTQNHVSFIINACHPFAVELHTTVAAVSDEFSVIRFEREFAERITHPLVHYVNDYTQALAMIKANGYKCMLALSGVQSIAHLGSFWKTHKCWFRILDRKHSTDFAASHGFPSQNLLFGLPQQKEEEIELFKNLKPEVILTKESGLNGKLDAKTQAAITCNIPIFIIKKPALSSSFKTAHNLAELIAMLQ